MPKKALIGHRFEINGNTFIMQRGAIYWLYNDDGDFDIDGNYRGCLLFTGKDADQLLARSEFEKIAPPKAPEHDRDETYDIIWNGGSDSQKDEHDGGMMIGCTELSAKQIREIALISKRQRR